MALGLKPSDIVDSEQYPLLIKAPHWQRVELGFIASVQNGAAFKSEHFNRFNGVPLIRIRDIDHSTTEHQYTGEYEKDYLVNTGDILVGMDGDFKVARWKGTTALLNQRVCRIFVQKNYYDEKFFFYCLQPYLNAINAETSSVTVKHLSSRSIEEIPLPLPPLIEQKRIVTKIEELFSELDKGIENLKTAREQLKVYRQTVLKHAFEGKLTAAWREKNKDKLKSSGQLLERIKQERDKCYQQQLNAWENGSTSFKPRQPKDFSTLSLEDYAILPPLPAGWAWSQIGSLFDVISGGTPKGIEETKGSEIPFYKVSDMNTVGNEIRMNRAAIYLSNTERSNLGLTQYPEGTIIFPKRGGAILTNKKRMLSRHSCFDLNIMGVVNTASSITDQYVWAWFQKLDLAKIYDGSNVPQINNKNVEPLPFPICSLDEQTEICRLLDERIAAIESSENEIIESLQKSESLRQSILKKAFSGQLVAQAPNDEPASTLLERIRAEKSAQKTNGQRPKEKRKAA